MLNRARRIALLLALPLLGCIDSVDDSKRGTLVDVYERGKPLVPAYFPVPSLSDADNDFIAPIAALHLFQMDERPLHDASVNYVVRALWSSFAFAGDSVVRIEKRKGGQVVSVFKRASAGKAPGSIADHTAVAS